MTEKSFAGKIAIVTGAASGIGAAIAEHLAEKGARIAGVDVSPALDDALASLPGEGHAGFRADLSDPEEAVRVVDGVVDRLGTPHILVNSAGVVFLNPATDLAAEDWKKTININLSGSFYMAQAAGRVMTTAGYGRIINLASQGAVVGLDQHAAYCASKAGIVGLTRVLSLEWAPRGVTVNAVSPTIVETPLGKKAWAGEKGERAKEQIPAGRFALPEEVAAMVGYLASDDAAMVTGSNMIIDGGYTSV
ncbi:MULTISPECIES: GolD/DthD family dehydrogenase [Micrococcaceae]|uniref:GolD/DthD family dehydrogenase n=1 Tax=unclassified Kocuria TaxID=2649579 RepID=UPI00101361D6|nr:MULTISPECIES: D-threitol dehydrogenase [unclassified Kocuria]